MKRSILKSVALAVGLTFAAPTMSALAQDKPMTLDELLDRVRKGRVTENKENAAREAQFKRDRNNQAQLLKDAQNEVAAEERVSDQLERDFQDNEQKLADLEATLAERMGVFGELFGVVRQVAGDTAGNIKGSLVSAQFPGRTDFLRELAKRKELPAITELEKLWFELQKEMTEQGKVVRFKTQLLDSEGKPTESEVIRVGPFVAIKDGEFMRYLEESQQLAPLGRQPGARFVGAAGNLEDAAPGELVPAALDPSRGGILGLLINVPSIQERVDQGGVIGYIILALAAIGVLIALERIITLSITSAKVRGQMKKDAPADNNPLGRILQVYRDNESVDVETLELKLDDAILKETPRLERWLSTLKTMAAVAPLLGLLGTVTGMIETFQMITLFGTGDPKVMAGGISQALITTVLGLVAAIPILLLHSLANSRSKAVVSVLEEQSAGIIAKHAEDHPHTYGQQA